MEDKEGKEKKFVTEYEINGEKYIGWIYAANIFEAKEFVRQRRATERVVGGPCSDPEEL